jgi:hypothetical protein
MRLLANLHTIPKPTRLLANLHTIPKTTRLLANGVQVFQYVPEQLQRIVLR